jgi:hypothetical protein
MLKPEATANAESEKLILTAEYYLGVPNPVSDDPTPGGL